MNREDLLILRAQKKDMASIKVDTHFNLQNVSARFYFRAQISRQQKCEVVCFCARKHLACSVKIPKKKKKKVTKAVPKSH